MHAGQKSVKKVYFVIPALMGGGAERVILHILKHIDRKRFEPYLVVFEKKGELLFDLPSDIGVRVLKKKKSTFGLQWLVFFSIARILKNERPDAVVSFMWYTNFITLLARLISGYEGALIISERYGLSDSHEWWFEEFLRRIAIRFFYSKADRIIVNAMEMLNQFRALYGVAEKKFEIIYNPVDISGIRQLSSEDVDCPCPWYQEDVPVIIAIGRLTQQKGFSYLIRALQRAVSEGIECRLVILGKGPEQESLERLAADLGIRERVWFAGFQQNPYKYLTWSTVFVLSSLYEGFPNVLLEAIALGVPSIATRCLTGPEEIITDGVDGILVPPADKRALADAIKRLLLDEELRKKIGEAGRKRAEDFAVEKILKQYESVIESVCAVSAET